MKLQTALISHKVRKGFSSRKVYFFTQGPQRFKRKKGKEIRKKRKLVSSKNSLYCWNHCFTQRPQSSHL